MLRPPTLPQTLEKDMAELSRDRTSRVKAAKEKLKGAKATLEGARKAARAAGGWGARGRWVGGAPAPRSRRPPRMQELAGAVRCLRSFFRSWLRS